MSKSKSLTQAQVLALIAKVLQGQSATVAAPKVQAKAKATPKAKRPSKDEMKSQLNLLTVTAFKAAGFTDVQPRVNVLTQAKWNAMGRTIKDGQNPVWVKAPWMTAKQMGYPMFHIDQTSAEG